MKRENSAAPAANGTINSFSVSNVRDTNYGCFFTLILNGVTINNCRVVEGKNGDFISLPSYKGNDGKYYSTVYFRFSNDDQQTIIDAVAKVLNDK